MNGIGAMPIILIATNAWVWPDRHCTGKDTCTTTYENATCWSNWCILYCFGNATAPADDYCCQLPPNRPGFCVHHSSSQMFKCFQHLRGLLKHNILPTRRPYGSVEGPHKANCHPRLSFTWLPCVSWYKQVACWCHTCLLHWRCAGKFFHKRTLFNKLNENNQPKHCKHRISCQLSSAWPAQLKRNSFAISLQWNEQRTTQKLLDCCWFAATIFYALSSCLIRLMVKPGLLLPLNQHVQALNCRHWCTHKHAILKTTQRIIVIVITCSSQFFGQLRVTGLPNSTWRFLLRRADSASCAVWKATSPSPVGCWSLYCNLIESIIGW